MHPCSGGGGTAPELSWTRAGREVAELRPIARQRNWMKRADFVTRVLANQADPALRDELRELAPDDTDDLKWQ